MTETVFEAGVVVDPATETGRRATPVTVTLANGDVHVHRAGEQDPYRATGVSSPGSTFGHDVEVLPVSAALVVSYWKQWEHDPGGAPPDERRVVMTYSPTHWAFVTGPLTPPAAAARHLTAVADPPAEQG